MSVEAEFVSSARRRFADVGRRLETTVGRLGPDDLEWRPNPESNSVSNLVLHVCGNLRQRFHAGLGGAPDTRDRPAEFGDRAAHTAAELVSLLRATFAEVDAVLAALPAERLTATTSVGGPAQSVTSLLLGAVCHASEHLGQVIYISKERLGGRFEALWQPGPPQSPGV